MLWNIYKTSLFLLSLKYKQPFRYRRLLPYTHQKTHLINNIVPCYVLNLFIITLRISHDYRNHNLFKTVICLAINQHLLTNPYLGIQHHFGIKMNGFVLNIDFCAHVVTWSVAWPQPFASLVSVNPFCSTVFRLDLPMSFTTPSPAKWINGNGNTTSHGLLLKRKRNDVVQHLRDVMAQGSSGKFLLSLWVIPVWKTAYKVMDLKMKCDGVQWIDLIVELSFFDVYGLGMYL